MKVVDDKSPRMDRQILRLAGYCAWAVPLVWAVIAGVLERRGILPRGWAVETAMIPLWGLLALPALYYGAAMARGLRPGAAGWGLSAAMAALPALAVWQVSGWEAGLTAALALAALVPFAATWGIPAAALLGLRAAPARAALAILCGLAPLAWPALPAGATLAVLATAPEDRAWRLAGIAAAALALIVIASAHLLTARARRAARRLLAAAETAAEPGGGGEFSQTKPD